LFIFVWVTVSLTLIGILAKYSGQLAERLHLPALIGMMIVGMLIGPTFLNLVPAPALALSAFLRDLALVAILFIGGLGISLAQMKRIGRFSVLLSTIPTLLEGFIVAFVAMILLNFSFIQGAILGFMIASVSPAILVPALVGLIKEKVAQDKAIPQMLLAGVSVESTISTTLFTIFLSLYLHQTGTDESIVIWSHLWSIPLTLIISFGVGYVAFKISKSWINQIAKPIVKTALAFSLCLMIRFTHQHFQFELFNSLFAVMVYGFFIHNLLSNVSVTISNEMNKVWEIGKLYLFTFVGMTINPTIIWHVLTVGILILVCALTIRSIGVLISLIGSNLTWKERLFCVIAYLPKATIQSTLAAIPLQAGVVGGGIIEAIVILSVLVTAPLGAIGIRLSSSRLLESEDQ